MNSDGRTSLILVLKYLMSWEVDNSKLKGKNENKGLSIALCPRFGKVNMYKQIKRTFEYRSTFCLQGKCSVCPILPTYSSSLVEFKVEQVLRTNDLM